MGISPDTVAYLKTLGHDAKHLIEERLGQIADSEVLAKARSEDRVVLTHDLDFSDLIAASGATTPSIILFRLRNMRPESVNRHLRQVLERFQSQLESGAVVTVTEGSVRVRELPIETRNE